MTTRNELADDLRIHTRYDLHPGTVLTEEHRASAGYEVCQREADALIGAGWRKMPSRDALIALLRQPEHAPLSDHDPRDGSCRSCPWPVHTLSPEDIADKILAQMDAPEVSEPRSLDQLRARVTEINRQHERLSAERKKLSDAIDEKILASRPTYPTESQRAGVVEIARMVREGIAIQSHHPQPVLGARDVRFSSSTRLVAFHALAPYNNRRKHAWEFIDEEVNTMRALLKREGLVITHEWPFEDGHAFVLERLGLR